jgi:hydrogenase nickel incorporation protein HypA/HybF
MHELSIAEAILEITLRHAGQANARHVVAIDLVIGELSSVIDDSLQFYWDIISKGTPAEGARLCFHHQAIELKCVTCNNIYQPGGDDFSCPACNSMQIDILTGEEFYLSSIDVE